MAKFLSIIFLMVIGYKLIAELPFFYKSAEAKQSLYFEDFKEPEKEKDERKKSDPDITYIASFPYQLHSTKAQELTVKLTSFENFKPHSGYTNPAFTPPDLICF